ncbi:MAG: hypothetical protein H7330_09650 [Hymenobacteraceae bacterium]|nr:hypothetical protein [Hymenobacteraceae bacterium]
MNAARRCQGLLRGGLLAVGVLVSAARSAYAQNTTGTTSVPSVPATDSARVLAALPGVIDSTLLLDAGARRVGLTTYALRSDVRGRVAGAPRSGPRAPAVIRYRVSTDWLMSTAPGEAFFVRQETRADVLVRLDVGRTAHQWTVDPFVQHAQNPAIQTAITTLGGRATWRGRLPGNGGDTLSTLHVGALVGVRRDVRRQYADAGPAIGAELAATWLPPNAPAGSMPVRVVSRVLRATFGPRVFTRVLAEAAWDVALPASTVSAGPGAVQLGAGWLAGRTDDYLSGNIQRIQSDTLTARLGVGYPLARGVTFRSDNALALPARQFAYVPVTGDAAVGVASARLRNSSFRQRDVQLRQEVRSQWRRLRGGVQFTYQERQRAYAVQAGRLDSSGLQLATAARQEGLKDSRERTSAWTTDAEWAPLPKRAEGPRHVFSSRTTAQILHLDTPSQQNQQDRDEVYYQARAQWATTWNSTFRTTLALAAERREFVYIKAVQSAENYTERVVAYEPGFRWNPGRFAWTADVQLRAIYQVRALRSEQGRNRATRLLQWQQEASYRFGDRAGTRREWLLTATYQRRESRFGVLRWPEFTESPLDTTIANDYLLALRHALPVRVGRPAGLRHAVRVGYRFFEQRVLQPGGLTVPGDAPRLIYRRDFTWQHGPELRYERALPARGLQLNAGVWLQGITTFRRYRPGKSLYAGPSLTPADFPNRARRTDPYFDMSIVWRWR